MKELKMLTPDEVSELLGVPYATLADLVRGEHLQFLHRPSSSAIRN